MNKRANLYLNIYEFISLLLFITCIGLSLTLKEISYQIPFILKSLSLFLGSFFGVLFVLIEVFLFLLMKKKYKLFYILFMLTDILLGIIINKKFAFYGLLIFLLFSIIKNILRIKLVKSIYIPKSFDKYCKLFNIKIDDFKKKKAIKEVIPKETIKIKVDEKAIKEKKATTKKKTASRKKAVRKES